MMVHSKICGITRPEDAVLAAQLGANAIGLVFFAGSKRCVSVEQAQRIVRSLPPFVQAVALFVNETEANIRHVLAHIPIHTLQFHGDEPPEFCQSFQRPFLKAVRVQSAHDIRQPAPALLKRVPCCLMRLWTAHTAARGTRSIGGCCLNSCRNTGFCPAD